MFTPDSRYLNQATVLTTVADGSQVSTVVPLLPKAVPVVGYHQRVGPGRLDLIAVQYLDAPTGFWRLCDAGNSMVPGALAARPFIGIPRGGPP